MIDLGEGITVAPGSIRETFFRASGHGGQNVNKVSTGVELRFSVRDSGLPEAVAARLLALPGLRLSADNEIIIEATESRAQDANRRAARERLARLIRRAFVRPKNRRATRPTRGSKERRLQSKSRRSEVKRSRSGGFD